MSRQVRLDELVAELLVEEYGDASLSAAANSALRAHYGLEGGVEPLDPPAVPVEPDPRYRDTLRGARLQPAFRATLRRRR